MIVHFFNYSPTIVKVTVLPLLGPSNSMKNTDCHVPKSSFPFLIGSSLALGVAMFIIAGIALLGFMAVRVWRWWMHG